MSQSKTGWICTRESDTCFSGSRHRKCDVRIRRSAALAVILVGLTAAACGTAGPRSENLGDVINSSAVGRQVAMLRISLDVGGGKPEVASGWIQQESAIAGEAWWMSRSTAESPNLIRQGPNLLVLSSLLPPGARSSRYWTRIPALAGANSKQVTDNNSNFEVWGLFAQFIADPWRALSEFPPRQRVPMSSRVSDGQLRKSFILEGVRFLDTASVHVDRGSITGFVYRHQGPGSVLTLSYTILKKGISVVLPAPPASAIG